MPREDGRKPDQMRPVTIKTGIQKNPEGSVQIAFGDTVVLCAASVAEQVPDWIKRGGKTHGWITAEYGMLPGSTPGRVSRRPRGRSEEIQRLIGRSLRAGADLETLSGFTITVDCDVLQADAGTRTAAITGGWVAVELAIRKLIASGKISQSMRRRPVCAISCVVSGGQILLDPDYPEDRDADVDMNFVLVEGGDFIEVQGTAEGEPFGQKALSAMLSLAQRGAVQLFEIQKEILQS
jgi:ribonuclease PH